MLLGACMYVCANATTLRIPCTCYLVIKRIFFFIFICESSNKIGESSNLINLYFICNNRGYPAMPRSINAMQYDWQFFGVNNVSEFQ